MEEGGRVRKIKIKRKMRKTISGRRRKRRRKSGRGCIVQP